MRLEPRATRRLDFSGHLTNEWVSLVIWLKTRSAPRRMACPIAKRLSPDFRARRRALAIDECSDDDDQRLTIRNSRGQSQCVELVFVTRFQEDLR